MADGIRTYQIVINGISESIKQVDALSDAIQFLDQKIKTLESRAINVSSSSSSGGGSKLQEYQTEDQVLKNIAKTEQEIANTRREEYQQLLADKELLKEAKQLQEERAASERLAANNYANTMRGVKQELSDIKKVMQGTDLGSDEFGKLTKRANELNNKLLQVEKSYGQFGRNVGNYPDAEKGMKVLSFTIAGVTQNFDNAKQAYATLKKELTTLQVKQDQGMLLSDEELQRFEELTTLVPSIASSIADAGKPMDNLLDTMESFVALTQVSKGFSSFFGLDNTKAEEALKKLMALQQAMQGLQKIQKQIQTGEGLGKYLKNFNDVLGKADDKIDKFTKSLFKVKRTEEEVTTASRQEEIALKGVGDGSKTAAAGASAATTANAALTTSEVAATFAAKALKMALKAIGIGVILWGIGLLVDGIEWAVKGIGNLYGAAAEKADEFKSQINMINAATDTAFKNIDKRVANGSIDVFKGQIEKLNAAFASLGELIVRLNEIKYDTDDVSIKRGINLINALNNSLDEAKQAMEDFKKAPSVEAAKKVEDIGKELNQLSIELAGVNTELANDEAATAYFNAIIDGLRKAVGEVDTFHNKIEEYQKDIHRYLQTDEQNEVEDVKKRKEDLIAAAKTEEQRKQIEKKANKEIAEIHKKYRNEAADKAKQYNAERLEAESTVEELRLRVLENGLKDRLHQLDKERSQTLLNFKGNQQQMLEIQKYYQQLRLKEVEKYTDEVIKKYDTYSQSLKNKIDETQKTQLEAEIDSLKSASERLPIIKQPFNAELISSSDRKELLGVFKYLEKEEKRLADKINKELAKNGGEVTETVNAMLEKLKVIQQKEDEMLGDYTRVFVKNLSDSLKLRLASQLKYQDEVLKQQEKYVDARVEKEKELAELTYKTENEAAQATLKADLEKNKEQIDTLTKTIQAIEDLGDKQTAKDKERVAKLKENLKEVQAAQEQDGTIYQAYYNKLQEIQLEFTKKSEEIDFNGAKEKSEINTKYFNAQIQAYRDFQTKINQEVDKQPIYDKLGFGIINLTATKRNLKEAEDAVSYALKAILEEKNKLSEYAKLQLISPEEYNNSLRSLNDLENAFKNTGKDVQNSLSELGGQWWGSIDKWVQEVGKSAASIMSSLSEITTNEFNKEIEAIENEVDKYGDLLDKQKDMTQKYADDVNTIEDELKTARGDRRQQLIDNLNAQMAAQRASLAEEKRIEKEQEKLEEKKKKLEYERDMAEWESNMWQAAINASMAISMAAVNKWPIPAVPMMALAAAVGAAQLAAVKSSKPEKKYAQGGVIDGRSHAQGGVKVFGGQIELEGGEFVTNKATTSNNVELLEYVNSKRKKLDLSDFVDFYSNGSIKKNIQSVRTKFAEGGQIPQLRSDILFNDRLVQSFEDYSNRPVVVAVTEIEDKMADVNNVRVLSGLNP